MGIAVCKKLSSPSRLSRVCSLGPWACMGLLCVAFFQAEYRAGCYASQRGLLTDFPEPNPPHWQADSLSVSPIVHLQQPSSMY